MRSIRILAPLAAVIVAGAVIAQTRAAADSKPMDPSSWGGLNFQTNLGSFKILRDRSRAAEGRLDVSFSGTLLIRGLQGTASVTSGQIRKEIDRKQNNITVYFGTGSMSVYGKFDAIQWFGKDMKGTFRGFGIARLYGEFDENLNTGTYTEEGSTEVRFWSPHGSTVPIPNAMRPRVTPTERKPGQNPPPPRP
ncbi:MAG TPA: hypothetical protein VM328_04270 [Fimbriimonadaceae bacterium]|nr:hypothetical protein [Fimbriimonadaceae bacterium]